MAELTVLYELQLKELKLDQLRKKLKELPVYEEFKKLQAEVADAKEAIGWTESKLSEQQKRVKRFEMNVQKTIQENKDIQAMLYSGSIKNAKELEQLEVKGKSLAREREKEEEEMLLAMEAVEDLQKSLTQTMEKHAALSQKMREMQQEGNKQIKLIKEEILLFQKERDGLQQQINEKLLERYREMRGRFHGRPLAHVEGEICGGCRVSLSSNLKNRLCNPNIIAVCENCGRILIP